MATGPGFQKIPNMYAECDFGREKLIRDVNLPHLEEFYSVEGQWP